MIAIRGADEGLLKTWSRAIIRTTGRLTLSL